jgi:predicted dehydrogenase
MSKLRWGIISTARIGTEHVIPAIQKAANCEVVGVASRSLVDAERVAASLGIERAYGAYEDLLAADDIDAVYNPLPNHLHKEWTIAALRAGKHVLCEKPMALNAADAQDMVDVAEAEGKALMEAFMYRHHPSWVEVKRMVDAGVIGDVRSIDCVFSFFNDDPDNIRNKSETGGGAVMDIGCYPISVARWLYGAEPLDVVARVRRDPTSGVDVVTSAILDFGGRYCTLVVSTRAEACQEVHVLGERGRIQVDIPFNIPPDRPSHIRLIQGGDPPANPHAERIDFAEADPYTCEAEAFAAAVLGGTPTPVPASDAVANMAVIDKVLAF